MKFCSGSSKVWLYVVCLAFAIGGCGSSRSSQSGQIVDEIASDTSYFPGPNDFVEVEIFPEMIYQEPAEYPTKVRQEGQQGTVWVKELVDEEGKVLKAIVGMTSGFPLLDNAAVEAGYKNKFNPGYQGGKPIKVWVTYKVEFKLSGLK